jgi:hypothetical protein
LEDFGFEKMSAALAVLARKTKETDGNERSQQREERTNQQEQ